MWSFGRPARSAVPRPRPRSSEAVGVVGIRGGPDGGGGAASCNDTIPISQRPEINVGPAPEWGGTSIMDRSVRSPGRGRAGYMGGTAHRARVIGLLGGGPGAGSVAGVHCSEGVDFRRRSPPWSRDPTGSRCGTSSRRRGCPSLRPDLFRVPAGGYLVRVVELEGGARSPGPEEGAFRATYKPLSIEGATPGRHQLRVGARAPGETRRGVTESRRRDRGRLGP